MRGISEVTEIKLFLPKEVEETKEFEGKFPDAYAFMAVDSSRLVRERTSNDCYRVRNGALEVNEGSRGSCVRAADGNISFKPARQYINYFMSNKAVKYHSARLVEPALSLVRLNDVKVGIVEVMNFGVNSFESSNSELVPRYFVSSNIILKLTGHRFEQYLHSDMQFKDCLCKVDDLIGAGFCEFVEASNGI